jgi:hypothetical protein
MRLSPAQSLRFCGRQFRPAELARLWSWLAEGQLTRCGLARRKGDGGKVELARALQAKTTMPLVWIAERLRMGILPPSAFGTPLPATATIGIHFRGLLFSESRRILCFFNCIRCSVTGGLRQSAPGGID